jgi:hypothetical protein
MSNIEELIYSPISPPTDNRVEKRLHSIIAPFAFYLSEIAKLIEDKDNCDDYIKEFEDNLDPWHDWFIECMKKICVDIEI